MASDQGPTKKPCEETASLASPPRSDGIPARIASGTVVAGRYRVFRCIGAGGMGEVYEAEDLQLERVVALKIVGPVDVDAETALSEARKAARLRHPFIATVFDAGIEQIRGVRAAYIAMEFVPGAERIDAWADRSGAGAPRALAMLARVCDAMAHAHARGVIHGDLKPTNILVDADGNPRIIDFGVSRVLGVDESLQAHRGGTPGYSAPEQMHRNAPALDGRVDVFALGVIARELLGPRTESEAATRDVSTLIDEATREDRAARLATVDELGENLRALADNRPLPLARRDAAYLARHKIRGLARRHPWIWLLASALIGFACAWTIGIPLVHTWTPIDRWVTGAMADVPRVGPIGVPLERVRVVLLRDQDDVETLAGAEGLTGVSAADAQSLRRLHGRLMEKLAGAGARAVVWDVRFKGDSGFDTDFIGGIDRLEASGTEVVVGAGDWRTDADGLPPVSRAILAKAGWGAFTANVDAVIPWRTDIVATRIVSPITAPGLALRTLGAVLHPASEMDVTLDADSGIATLRWWKPVPGVVAARTWVGTQHRVRMSGVRTLEADDPGLGLVKDDKLGYLVVSVPEDARLDQVTLGYSDVFTSSPSALRDALDGCVVFIANIRTGTHDIYPHPGGRRLPGVWAQACAFDALERAATTRYLTPPVDAALVGVFALGASAAGMLGRGRTKDRLIFLACLVTLCTGLMIGAYALGGLLVNTIVQAIGGIVGWEGSGAAARLRRT